MQKKKEKNKEIILTEEQKAVIKGAANMIKQGKDIVTIAGPAGSSKTTIAKYIVKELGYDFDDVSFCTFTGQASQILTRKGTFATTIHQTIYHSYKDKRGQWHFNLMTELEKFTRLFVVDEISMVGNKLLNDLKSFGVPIIALGDPNQLPPVRDDKNDLLDNPDFTLTKVFRQADGNTILDFAQDILTEGATKPKQNDEFVKHVPLDELNISMLIWASQVLCCKVATKKALDQKMRAYFGKIGDIPQVGDKVICTSNRWNIFPNNGYPQPLMNGTVGYITAIRKTKLDTINPYMDVDFAVDYNMNMVYSVRIDLNPFYGRAEYVNKYNKREIQRREFGFGYAITVHKSQGSEYDKVLVYAADGWGDLKKLYYTAATRASKKLVWVK